jgi:hypothetical protein
LCLAAAVASPLAAQTPPAEYLQVLTVGVRPSAVTEYEDYVKKVVGGLAKSGAPQVVLGFQPGAGAPGYTYEFIIPFEKWADLDGFLSIPQVLAKAYGEVPGAAAWKAGRATVEGSRNAIYRVLRSVSAASIPPHSLAHVIVTEVDPAMTGAYEMYLGRLKAAQDKAAGNPATVRWVSVEGPASTYLTARFFGKLAERDSWPSPAEALRQAFGEAEARHLTEMSLRAVRSRTSYVTAMRPDLSRPPAGAPAAK